MTPEAMNTLVKQYFAATRAMDVTAWLACFADDAGSHDPYGGTAMHGKGELTRFFQSVGGAFKKSRLPKTLSRWLATGWR